MRPGLLRLLLALALLCAAAGIGVISLDRARDQLAVIEACDAGAVEDWASVLEKTAGLLGPDELGRSALECRCRALLATGAGDECVALLERAASDPAADDWVPGPQLAIHLIQTWRDAGLTPRAAEFARRASSRHPEDPDLFYLELVTRSSLEDEEGVLEEMAARVGPRGPHVARMRASLAKRHLLRGAAGDALDVLGAVPPPDAGASLGLWFESRGMAFATAGDLGGVRRTYEAWQREGGRPAELQGRYALTLSIAGLRDPDLTPIDLLSKALAASGRAGDPALEEALTIRLILTLVNDGRSDEALATYERSRLRFELGGLSRDELERSASHRLLADAPLDRRRGSLRFAVDSPEAGGELLVSPEPDAAVDTAFESYALPASGVLSVSRALGPAPQRWVYRDADGHTRASGTVAPRAGSAVHVSVSPGSSQERQRVELSRRPGDDRRRVVMLLLDCGDWRIVQYLRTRGELPVLDALVRQGQSAVLHSDPPLTAAALESLVWPRRRGSASFVGLLHQLGVELAGLDSIGDNPFAALSWLLPEERDLFAVVGSGKLTAANLLFSHGGIRAGRHNELTGPHGRRRRVPLASSARDLDADERAWWPALAAVRAERDAIHIRTIAAELDAAEALARDRGVDLVVLRIEPLDILTHAHFADSVRNRQDDGKGLLFSVYRYIDARLGDIHDQLDADDVFVVFSDHGIRTAMEHSPLALFVAAGPDLPRGRTPGRPALRGIARMVADLLGVDADWPDTGVAPWARALGPGRARHAEPVSPPEPSPPLASAG